MRQNHFHLGSFYLLTLFDSIDGEICFDNTPCDSDISTNQPYYCGLSEAEAAGKCWQPCPGGQDSECCFGQTW
jgi:hypothetical protein